MACLTLSFGCSAPAQPLTFNTLAGYAGPGSVDGLGASARFYNPAGAALDQAGNLYIADSGNDTIRKITPAGSVSTWAGLPGVSGSADGTNNSAFFSQPRGVAVDTNGNVYVADSANNTIRKITPAGVVTTLAGSAGVSGSANGAGTNALFFQPQGVSVDGLGNVYVADYGNHTIRKISATGQVSTLAGLAGNFGSADGTGTNAQFYQPQGTAVDAAGNVYVADTANNAIRKITSAGAVSTLAGWAANAGSADGAGTNAQFYQPASIAIDASANLYVADYFNDTIRKVTPAGLVTTLAGLAGNLGSADGTNNSARFWGPQGIAVSPASNLTVCVSDTFNGTIRQVQSVSTNWVVSTLAGSGSIGNIDGVGSSARFFWPAAVGVDTASNIYVADTQNGTIRKISATGATSTLAGMAGHFGSADGQGTNAQFNAPQGEAVDGAGNVFVADTANETIRQITPAGVVSTLAGLPGTRGSADGTGASAQFYEPQGLALDSAGNLFVADTWNSTIRKVTPGGVVTTLAGSVGVFGNADGTNNHAQFNWPAGVAVDTAGNVYVADYFNNTVRMLTITGTNCAVSTLAGLAGVWGSADGTNSSARFYEPQGIVVDAAGNLWVADSGNESIRKLTPSGTNWVVSTVAGWPGWSGSTDGSGANAQFYYPKEMALDAAGNIYVADTANNSIRAGRLITNSAPTIIDQPQSQTVGPGSIVTFAVTAAGLAPLYYQWQWNGTAIAGATNIKYSIAGVQSNMAGNYSVIVINQAGSVASSNAVLAITGPPFIVVQPLDQTVFAGQTTAFKVVASGTPPLQYQWLFRGNPLPGATNSSMTVASAQATNDGFYSVIVTNSLGLANSSNALLSVVAAAAWGDNSFGQTSLQANLTNLIAVAAGGWHNLALRADGTIAAWGDDAQGQRDVPPALDDALAIAAGGYHSLAIRASGIVTTWGANDHGQTNVPPGLVDVIAVAAGTWHSLALRGDGTVAAWGDNQFGQTNLPTGLSNAVAIAAGGNHSLALLAGGNVRAWGQNTDAQGNYAGQCDVPAGLTNVVAIAAGDYHSLAVRSDGTVAAWGYDSQGQCDVPAGLGIAWAVAGGGAHTLALGSSGGVSAWGANTNGQCNVPPGLTNAVAVSAGEGHSLVLLSGSQPVARILRPAWRGSQFSVVVQTLNRKNYALQFKNSLAATNWTALTTVPGNGALRLLVDPSQAPFQRFYRVQQW